MAKPIDLYPKELLVTIENDQGDVYYSAHKSARDVMKSSGVAPTVVCVYKRDRRIVLDPRIDFREAEEQDDAKA